MIHDIADLSEAAQARLMRLLETWSFRRLESDREMRARLRVVGIGEHDLDRLVENGDFRRDLYHRLAIVRVPSLASTPEDIAGLARAFLPGFARRSGIVLPRSGDRSPMPFSPSIRCPTARPRPSTKWSAPTWLACCLTWEVVAKLRRRCSAFRIPRFRSDCARSRRNKRALGAEARGHGGAQDPVFVSTV